MHFVKGSLEVKLPTIWTVEQPPSVREMKDRKCAKCCVLRCFVLPDDPTGSLGKAAGAEGWQKLARRLRAKHIWKSKVAKHLMVGALLEDAT